MKAEHRKELHTNVLADRMGRLLQGMRDSPSSATTAIWTIVILTIGTFVGWYVCYLTGGSAQADSRMWVRFDDDSYNKDPTEAISDLNQLLDSRKSMVTPALSMPGRAVRFQQARLLLARGLQNLCFYRSGSVNDLVQSRKIFKNLIPECGDEALLHQEALWSAATAEEALVGIPDEVNKEKKLGNLDEALRLYRLLAQTYPNNSFLGLKATKRVLQIEKNREEIEKFYATLNDLADKKQALPTMKFPGMDPLGP